MLLFAYYPRADERNTTVGVASANECPANPRWSRPRKAIAIGLTVAANICWVGYRGAATQLFVMRIKVKAGHPKA